MVHQPRRRINHVNLLVVLVVLEQRPARLKHRLVVLHVADNAVSFRVLEVEHIVGILVVLVRLLTCQAVLLTQLLATLAILLFFGSLLLESLAFLSPLSLDALLLDGATHVLLFLFVLETGGCRLIGPAAELVL